MKISDDSIQGIDLNIKMCILFKMGRNMFVFYQHRRGKIVYYW